MMQAPALLRDLTCRIGGILLRGERIARKPLIKPFTLVFIFASLAMTATAYAVSPWYVLMVNRSNSLPGTLFLLDRTMAPGCGDTTVFDMPSSARFYPGSRMIKKILGCAGDVISVSDRMVFINQREVAVAMERTTNQKYELHPITPGLLPANKVYLAATHKRSYDSRYESFGLRDTSELLGTAKKLF